MAKYLILNLVATCTVVAVLILLSRKHKLTFKPWLAYIMAVLLVLTAIFDSLIVWSSIVAYNPNYILGLYIGKAPLEDFFYSVVVVLLVPVTWQLLDSNVRSKKHE